MIRTWLRRWLGLNDPVPVLSMATGSLERRISELEEHVDFLHGALRKLRGRVTGGLRGNPAPDGEDGGPVSDAPVAHQEFSGNGDRQWQLAELARTRSTEHGRTLKGGA